MQECKVGHGCKVCLIKIDGGVEILFCEFPASSLKLAYREFVIYVRIALSKLNAFQQAFLRLVISTSLPQCPCLDEIAVPNLVVLLYEAVYRADRLLRHVEHDEVVCLFECIVALKMCIHFLEEFLYLLFPLSLACDL